MTQPSANETVPAIRHMSEGELVRFTLADDYEILEELGRGGMAIVYRAREKALDREVAIKVLPTRLVIDQDFVQRFEHEARTAAKLEHPNIVPIYRVGRAGPNGDVIYFVMKLLRGQSLSAVLAERKKLDPSVVRRILVETASALHYAAKRSVVHRDIKPDNIMLDSEGRCVITDFGIAKAPGGQQTTAGTSLGTPRYMSPEHAMGLQLDGRSDMYSLGVVAYQCLFGKAPFEADEPFAVLYKHIHDPVPEPTLDTDEAKQLYPIIARMLAKRPDDRYQTGNELVAALGGQASDPSLVSQMVVSPGLMAPTERMPTPKPWSLSRWRMLSRTRQLVWSGVAVLIVATTLGLVLDLPTGNAGAAPPGTGATANQSGGPAGTKTPPLTKGATVTTPVPGDPSAVPAAPKPSARALAILAANKVASKCAKIPDTLATTKPIGYRVILDSVGDRKQSNRMDVGYDVCGLEKGVPFSAHFTLTKLRQRGFGQQKPLTLTHPPDLSTGPRMHQKWVLDISAMSAGSYRLDLQVVDSKQRQALTSREFKINEK
jgi:serine/threonine protein kinase